MKKNALILMLLFTVAISQAQNVGIGTTTPQAPLTVAANKTVLFGADTLNAGTKMMWLPAKGAFRVGTVTGVNWDADSIGLNSFASGYTTRAKGYGATAMGGGASASGNYSTAIGFDTKAIGATSTAMGIQTNATGYASTSMGKLTTANGENSIAMGSYATANGDNSIAMGSYTNASGENSISMGYGTVARAYASLSLGKFNDSISTSSQTAWVASDPLLILGNGGPAVNVRSNALVVYKNGNTDINGFTQLGKASEAAPKIKMKELTLNSATTANGQNAINHGLISSQIISVSALMEWTPGFFAPVEYSPDPLLRYNYFISPTQIIIQNNAANCTYICNKQVKVLITYKE